MAEEKNNNVVSTMNTEVSDFLKENVESGEKQEEIKFDRFKSPFIIKALTANESDEVSKLATKKTRNKKTGQTITEFDSTKYGALLSIKAIVQPDLNSEELQKSYGTLGSAEKTLNAMLMASEMGKISQKILQLSGLDDGEDNEEDLVEQVKK